MSMHSAWWAASVHTLPQRCTAEMDQASAAGVAAAAGRSASLALLSGAASRAWPACLRMMEPAGVESSGRGGLWTTRFGAGLDPRHCRPHCARCGS